MITISAISTNIRFIHAEKKDNQQMIDPENPCWSILDPQGFIGYAIGSFWIRSFTL